MIEITGFPQLFFFFFLDLRTSIYWMLSDSDYCACLHCSQGVTFSLKWVEWFPKSKSQKVNHSSTLLPSEGPISISFSLKASVSRRETQVWIQWKKLLTLIRNLSDLSFLTFTTNYYITSFRCKKLFLKVSWEISKPKVFYKGNKWLNHNLGHKSFMTPNAFITLDAL